MRYLKALAASLIGAPVGFLSAAGCVGILFSAILLCTGATFDPAAFWQWGLGGSLCGLSAVLPGGLIAGLLMFRANPPAK